MALPLRAGRPVVPVTGGSGVLVGSSVVLKACMRWGCPGRKYWRLGVGAAEAGSSGNLEIAGSSGLVRVKCQPNSE